MYHLIFVIIALWLSLESRIEPDRITGIASRLVPSLRHIKESPYHWYKMAMPYQGLVSWRVTDTIEVVLTDSTVVRAKEQWAVTPAPEMKLIPLRGILPVADLNQLPYKHGRALMLWVAFSREIERKRVADVRVGTATSGRASHLPTPRRANQRRSP